ncbi:type VI secretion system lipoprotein TssJ [Marinomonas mediterranea]|jgi:type VI secretion lipoprotein, VC_A0113 family|uniref:Type VI secretion lipoprotein, VC_A0113 family n=1 Tax=Marinomonas mediterranea (strain ATCC 700492 / JCM 21426 / NBRC 103028 / MMB-1) TaxID=717774 RepID=F2JW01_MARM1|nr:type VI secretion system lipoprotein TssJ [Marinomonas mediterranea]ADZ92889.1 type VI secretion lipoprotein, VC_A0113 family [Marinomonas mediterranea MMB-1]WCN10822.1 type VI secretion system lipoprotein TssJ [Marinomonas mediterranea]WCN14879.1 type VI secretion system lipoprotein TssJ [Marinomonas mediterranea]WCN18911.1 type VI secretion system lipoprotein TssJ [Marinomonas mediterranea MMB-1]
MLPIQICKSAVAILLVFTLFGCSTTRLSLDVNASSRLNPDAFGNVYSVIVRVYQLSDARLFEEASYDELWKSSESALQDSVLSVEEYTISPDYHGELVFERLEAAKHVGVMAFFRSREGVWKVYDKIQSGLLSKTAKLEVNIAGYDIEMVPR